MKKMLNVTHLREMSIQTALRYYLHPDEGPHRKQKRTSVGEVEKLDHLSPTGGKVKQAERSGMAWLLKDIKKNDHVVPQVPLSV